MPVNEEKQNKMKDFVASADKFVEAVRDYSERNVVEYEQKLSRAPKNFLRDVSGDSAMIATMLTTLNEKPLPPTVKDSLTRQLVERITRFETDVNAYKREVGGDSGVLCDGILADLTEIKRMQGITTSASAEMSSPSMKNQS